MTAATEEEAEGGASFSPDPQDTGECAFCHATGTDLISRWRWPELPSAELDLSGLRALVESYELCQDVAGCNDRVWDASRAQCAAEAPSEPVEPAANEAGHEAPTDAVQAPEAAQDTQSTPGEVGSPPSPGATTEGGEG